MVSELELRGIPYFNVSICLGEENYDYWVKMIGADYPKMSLDEIEQICKQAIVDKMVSGIVYCYRNKINDKRYIGQTIQPKFRHYTHLSSSREGSNRKDKNTPIHRAIRKYGIDPFEYQVIGLVVAKNNESLRASLDKIERDYISRFKSNKDDCGYNILDGGVGGKRVRSPIAKEVHQYSKTGEYIATYPSVAEAMRMTGTTGIYSVIRNKRHRAGNYVFVYDGDPLPTHIFEKFLKRRVHQYTVDGEYVASFDSSRDAAKVVGGDVSRIDLCSKPPCINIAYGYRWSKDKIDRLNTEATSLQRSVCQYDLEGNFVAQYSSITEATRAVGLKWGSWITDGIKNPTRTPAKYYWRYEKVDKIDIPTPLRKVKK